ncbi:hypothetical protein F5884DRAFT_783650 [Xylogone sp. PMI_703]|nr:hypothetical protein F5884DRAFT_783650 [Xylogone sp. PMI_703]
MLYRAVVACVGWLLHSWALSCSRCGLSKQEILKQKKQFWHWCSRGQLSGKVGGTGDNPSSLLLPGHLPTNATLLAFLLLERPKKTWREAETKSEQINADQAGCLEVVLGR